MDFTHVKLPNTLFHMIFVFQRGSDVFSALHVVGSSTFGSTLFYAGTFDVGDAGMFDA